MSLKIPSNQITYRYTAGEEFIIKSTKENYIGYYYIFNDNIYAGNSFSTNNPILEGNVIEESKNSFFQVSNDDFPSIPLSLLLENEPPSSVETYKNLLQNSENNNQINLDNINTLSSLTPFIIDFSFSKNSSKAVENYVERFFIKSIKDNIVKEVTEEGYQRVKKDPLYATYIVKFTYYMSKEEIDQIEKQFPGIEDFLNIDPITSTLDDK